MIYLDNAATTKPDAGCLKQAEKYLVSQWFNASALYAEGYGVQRDLQEAKKNILSVCADAQRFDLIFTSGGTEADNHAVFSGGRRGNIVTTAGEHAAVYSSVTELKQRGMEVRFADLNADGSVNVQSLIDKVDAKTSLVSVVHVNNETGAINDVAALAAAVKAKNKAALFHSDGVQAFGKIDVKLTDDIDLYAVSAHKIGGIKGCGALIKRKGLAMKPFVYGGGQEQGLRSGTENVFAVKDFEYAAVKKYKDMRADHLHVQKLNRILCDLLDKNLFTRLSPPSASPYILLVGAAGVRGETILHEADDRGLIIGTGSACASNEKKRYSRVMLACGIDKALLDGVLRLSFSPENTEEEVRRAAQILNEVVENRKKMMA